MNISDTASRDDLPCFELGLVMAGAVSGGAYQAGVLDFLVEALEAWEDAKRKERENNTSLEDERVPRHSVKIRVITGASAGSISAALLTRRMGKKYVNMTDTEVKTYAGAPNARSDVSPLLDTWVRGIDIEQLLDTEGDTNAEGRLSSLLNSVALDDIIASLRSRPPPEGTTTTAYLADPLDLAFTACDLDGTPVEIDATGADGIARHRLRRHSHAFQFRIHALHDGQRSRIGDSTSLSLEHIVEAGSPEFDALIAASLASSAFPIGLPPRKVQVKNLGSGSTSYTEPWFVDGGVFDNEPVVLARNALWKDLDPDTRGRTASKALLLIDPFPDAPGAWDTPSPRITDTALRLMTAWKNQSRFRESDIEAARSETSEYHMYMIAPDRTDGPGDPTGRGARKAHLASSALGAFGGFLHRDFRVHDYLLGRSNAQLFLSEWLSLPENNPLFARWPSSAKSPRGNWSIDHPGRQSELPIIPLMDRMNPRGNGVRLPEPDWPRADINMVALRRLVRDRLKRIIFSELTFGTGGRFAATKRYVQEFLLRRLLHHVTEAVMKAITDDLTRLELVRRN